MVGGCLWCSSLIYVFSVGNSIELLGFKYHRQSKKKKKHQSEAQTNQPTKQVFNHTFISHLLSTQPLFPTIEGHLPQHLPRLLKY